MGAALAVVGLALVAYGLLRANALVSFATVEELRSERQGRQLVYVGCALLVAASAALAASVGSVAGLAVLAPGVVCALLVALAPQSAYGLLAFAVLGPLAALTLVIRLSG